MKALRTLFAAVALLAGVMTMNAQRMSIVAIQSNARFLTDRMAYTLGIHDPYLIDEIYRINYDYIWGVNEYLDDVALGYYYDDYLAVCAARDAALRSLLGVRIWNSLIGYSYFHRPIVFANRGWHFSIYDYDRFGPRHFYFGAPRPIARGYAGGHFFHGMAPRGGRPAGPASGMAPHNPPHHMGGAPQGGMNRGGGVPQGGMNQRGGVPQGNPQGNPNMGGRTNPNMGGQPQMPTQPSGNVTGGRTTVVGGNSGTRSSNNLRSSSRSNAGSNFTPAPRSNAGATRSGGTGGATRGGGSIGGARGGGRR
ncbi:MAG: hypothetical protein IJ635_08310 [Bacteroidaceae bacterium]|nr:hypothetical protein [Bacteroidaceae bacterium]